MNKVGIGCWMVRPEKRRDMKMILLMQIGSMPRWCSAARDMKPLNYGCETWLETEPHILLRVNNSVHRGERSLSLFESMSAIEFHRRRRLTAPTPQTGIFGASPPTEQDPHLTSQACVTCKTELEFRSKNVRSLILRHLRAFDGKEYLGPTKLKWKSVGDSYVILANVYKFQTPLTNMMNSLIVKIAQEPLVRHCRSS